MPQSAPSLLFALTFNNLPPLTAELQAWLLLESSMTQRLASYCRQLTVSVTREDFSATPQSWLPWLPAMQYWQREITLYADGTPWLMAQTLVPETTLSGDEQKLLKLGNTPLGQYLFSHPRFKRDFIRPGQTSDGLWGRRSGVQLGGKPLLVTELFLADAPIYHQEPECKNA